MGLDPEQFSLGYSISRFVRQNVVIMFLCLQSLHRGDHNNFQQSVTPIGNLQCPMIAIKWFLSEM